MGLQGGLHTSTTLVALKVARRLTHLRDLTEVIEIVLHVWVASRRAQEPRGHTDDTTTRFFFFFCKTKGGGRRVSSSHVKVVVVCSRNPPPKKFQKKEKNFSFDLVSRRRDTNFSILDQKIALETLGKTSSVF